MHLLLSSLVIFSPFCFLYILVRAGAKKLLALLTKFFKNPVDNISSCISIFMRVKLKGRFFSAKISADLGGHGQITFAFGNGRDLSTIWIVVNTQKKHMFNWVQGGHFENEQVQHVQGKTFKNSSLTG